MEISTTTTGNGDKHTGGLWPEPESHTSDRLIWPACVSICIKVLLSPYIHVPTWFYFIYKLQSFPLFQFSPVTSLSVWMSSPWVWQCVVLFRTGGRSRRRSRGSWRTANSPWPDGKDALCSPELQSRCATPAVGGRVCRRFARTVGLLWQQRLWQQLRQRR